MNPKDIETTLRARAEFDRSVGHLDADTIGRLRAARLQALLPATRPRRQGWIWPAGMATAAVLAMAVFLPTLPHTVATRVVGSTIAPPTQATSSSLPASVKHGATTPAATHGATTPAADVTDTTALEAGDPDLLSDLDFYGWLAAQPDTDHFGG